MFTSSHRLRPFVLLVCCLASACSSTTAYELSFESTARLNLDDDNNPSRLDVKIYLLRKKEVFLDASFEELWNEERAKAKLGDGLVGVMSSALGKSAKLPVQVTLPAAAQFVGIVGNFVTPDKSGNWRECLARSELSSVPLLFGEHGLERKK